jgi:pyruvate,water dikinase
MGALRLPLAALGKRLAESGVFADPGDVFFLEVEELAPVAAGTFDALALVAERRRQWERNVALEAPQTLGLPISWEMVGSFSSMARRMFGAAAIQAPTATVVSGIGASGGVATGRARVVRSLDEAEGLEDGDILVCPSTSPPWTPYLAIVSALVTNSGGVLCHAAIEAREYGIPAVVGTLRATELIVDGATVTVDGTAGTITIL